MTIGTTEYGFTVSCAASAARYDRHSSMVAKCQHLKISAADEFSGSPAMDGDSVFLFSIVFLVCITSTSEGYVLAKKRFLWAAVLLLYSLHSSAVWLA